MMPDRRTIRSAAARVGLPRGLRHQFGKLLIGQVRANPSVIIATKSVHSDANSVGKHNVRNLTSKIRLPRFILGPKAVIVLLVMAVTLCLGSLIYVQHTNSLIVNHDMETAVSLSEIAARFDHEDGSLYRLLVDEAASGRSLELETRLAEIRRRIDQISADLVKQRKTLKYKDRKRATEAVAELAKYNEAVGIVSSMLEISFPTSVAMLQPFRKNADHVLAEVKAIAASGISDAHYHAEAAAWRTRLLVGFVTGAVLIVAALSYIWLTLAAQRGVQLQAEIKRRGKAEQEALLLARTDALTGLVNRRQFGSTLESAVESATEISRQLSIMLIDLDGFKNANDTYGHAAGDAVLKAVAHRLLTVFGAHNTIARLGGDEFAILISEVPDGESAMHLAQQASGILHEPLAWRSNMIAIGASIGISRFPEDGAGASELLHAADIAMYDAKRGSKGGVRLFSQAMEAERVERRRLEQELRDGIARGEVQPFYQPIVRFIDNKLCGFEVLARWRHPRLGLLAPDAFIRLAETTGQITFLTKSILQQVCVDALQMPAHLRLAVNISPTQLEEVGLAESLIAIMHAQGVSPSRFEIEITEDAVMDDLITTELAIQKFRDSGISIALDDFGTGYSSLSNLHRLRFDKLKIDQSFIRSLLESPESEKLVDAIISLALSFDMIVTAEGVEDVNTAEVLASKGCTQGQGYYFGRPISFVDTRHISIGFGKVAA